MKELFDVHCHMVPGVDDGAADLEESLAMLKMQHEDGVRKIIITPHYRRRMFETPAKKVHEQFLKLQEAAKKEYPDMSLYLGCELHSNMDLQDILEKRKYVTMAVHPMFCWNFPREIPHSISVRESTMYCPAVTNRLSRMWSAIRQR